VETNITVTYSFEPEEEEHTASGAVAKKIGNGVSAPRVIYQVNPEFTNAARKAAIAGDFKGGNVLVHLIVDEQGTPQNVRVVRGIGYGLDENAVASVNQYKFTPAVENGQPVPVGINIEVNYQTF
jgi:TonB family protein